MINCKTLNLFKDAKAVERISDPKVIDKNYKYWRIRTMYAMYIGYACFYFTRKSFTFVIPQMIQDLHFTKTQIGVLGSVFYIAYGISKFISGMISDRSNPRYFMAIGLILTGVANIFFGFSTSLACLITFWLINALFQGWGWPPCARLLTHWYSKSERGMWWSIWNTSHNLGGALIPVVVAVSVAFFGNWRAAMFVPGTFAIIVGLFLIDRLRSVPESQGLPPIETYKNDHSMKETKAELNLPIIQIFFNYILKNKYIWFLAFSYVAVYVVRTAINDWGAVYLIEKHKYNLITANSCMAFFEIGGFVGALVAGWCSDKIFKGLRGQTNVLFSIGTGILLLLFWYLPLNSFALHSSIMFGVGFFIFGPQMLVGMMPAELSHREAAGTSTGFVGLFGYMGAALSGYPIGKVLDIYKWDGFFVAMIASAVLSILLLLPLWKASGYKHIATKKRG